MGVRSMRYLGCQAVFTLTILREYAHSALIGAIPLDRTSGVAMMDVSGLAVRAGLSAMMPGFCSRMKVYDHY